MLQFDEVTLSFSGIPLFEDVSFQIQKGEKCALVGKNGSGKSTLFKLIVGELDSDRGAISFPKGYAFGYLKQHILFTEPTLLQEAACGLDESEIYKAETILFGLGFTANDLDRPPEEFSGGFQLRLHLAKVLVANPDCLLLDEPTNYLDILSIRWLENFLREWKGEFIIISHDREFLDSVCTHTMGLHRKKMRKIRGNTIAFFEQIVLEEEVHEKTRLKSDKKQAHMREFIERFGAKATKATQAQSRMKMLAREPVLEKLAALENLAFHFPEANFPGKKMLEGEDLHFSYTKEPLLQGISLTIEKGERVAIIGKNGRGKSTLLNLLSGETLPQKGRFFLSENAKIGFFGQTHIDRLYAGHTVEEEISSANRYLNTTEVRSIAGKMMFGKELSEKKISVLSGGEKSRVLLGKILATPSNLLLLDEPTHHLDIESIEALIDAIEDFSGSVVIVTHSELILRRMALTKLVVCEKGGQLVFQGDYDLFLEKRGWEEEKKEPAAKKKTDFKKTPSLKPLLKKIEECEAKIAKLEEEQRGATEKLESGAYDADFLKEMSERELAIEENYKLLEELHRVMSG